MTLLMLQLLGGFCLRTRDGRAIKISSRKGRALLAYLAVRNTAPHSREKLAALLWEDADRELARTSLRQTLAALRKTLPPNAQAALRSDAVAVELDGNLIDSDLQAFQRSLDVGTRVSLQEALNHYHGDLLDGVDARSTAFDNWLSNERLVLRRQFVGALRDLTQLCIASNDIDSALTAGVRLIAADPLNEAAQRTVMELHAHRGAFAEALRQYRLCRAVLHRELDVAPEPATEQLYRDIMRRRRTIQPDVVQAESLGPIDVAEHVAADDRSTHQRRSELRDATVLVARLDGLLALETDLDPEELFGLSSEFQRRVQQIATRFGGCCDRRVGSSVMVVFGLPTAYGNEAEQAARAAFALRNLLDSTPWPARMALRLGIGLAQGQVLGAPDIFPITGRAAQKAYSLAARAARRGSILVTDELHRALEERVPMQLAHDSDEPSKAWSLESPQDRIATHAPPLVGRRPELALILASLERCRETGCGHTIVIRGEAGIGKTRLADAVCGAAVASGVNTHVAPVFDFGQSPGRRPMTTLALSLLGLPAEAEPALRATAVATQVQALQLSIDQRIFLSDLVEAPLESSLAALQRAMDIATRQLGRTQALAQLIEHAARRTPQLILIEDVHWAHSDELARFGELAVTARNAAVLLIMTTRPERDPLNAAWRARTRGCSVTTIELAPLTEDEAQALAAHYSNLPSEVSAACIRRAEGYPLFLHQLLRAAVACDTSDTLPGSVRTLVLARADRLTATDHQALQAAAILGQQCALEALQFLVAQPDYVPSPLCTATLLHTAGDEVGFAHALFRDAIYESILKSRRRELHSRAAEWYATRDAVLHADHLAAAESPRSCAAYVAAVRTEQTHLRFERALLLSNKARASARTPEELHQTSCLLGEVLLQLNRTHDALTAYREALDFATHPAAQGHAWFGIAGALRIMDRHAKALDALSRSATALERSADAQMKARLFTLRGNLYFPLGQLAACQQAHEQALSFAHQAHSPLDIARALGGLGDASYQRGAMCYARRRFARCVNEAQQHALADVLVANLPMLAITECYCCQFTAAEQHFKESLELAHQIGDLRADLLVQLGLALLFQWQARLGEALACAQRSFDLACGLGARRFQAEALGLISLCHQLQGNSGSALRHAADALQLGRETGMSYCGPILLSCLARAATDRSVRSNALQEGERLLAAGCVSHSYFEFYNHAIEVSVAHQDWSEVQRYADCLQSYTRAEAVPWSDLLIRRAHSLAQCGAGQRAARRELQAIREECERLGTRSLLPAIDVTLAG